ncbi:MAG: DNA-binding protein [Candidatus Micrarchaeia archaeon]
MSKEEENDDEESIKAKLAENYKRIQIEEQKKALIRRLMTPEAYERMMNIRIANPELYSQLSELLISMAQSGKLGVVITEDQLKMLISKLTVKREPKFEIKHK